MHFVHTFNLPHCNQIVKSISSYICSSPERDEKESDDNEDVTVEQQEKDQESANDSEGLDANEIYTNWSKLEQGSKLQR